MIKVDSETDLDLSGNCVIKFFTSWCMPCKKLDVILENMSEEFPDVVIYALDLDNFSKLAQKYRIMSVPTLIFLNHEKETKQRIVGLTQTEDIRKAFKEFIRGSKK